MTRSRRGGSSDLGERAVLSNGMQGVSLKRRGSSQRLPCESCLVQETGDSEVAHGVRRVGRDRWTTAGRFAYLVCAQRDVAQDLTQDVLVAAYSRWSRLAAVQNMDAYLKKALVNRYHS